MVKEEPVSLLRQTIYCLLPILDMYAAYKIRRLRRYLLIMIFLVGIPLSIISSVSVSYVMLAGTESITPFLENIPLLISLASYVGSILIAIYLVRKWSKQWNLRFSVPPE